MFYLRFIFFVMVIILSSCVNRINGNSLTINQGLYSHEGYPYSGIVEYKFEDESVATIVDLEKGRVKYLESLGYDGERVSSSVYCPIQIENSTEKIVACSLERFKEGQYEEIFINIIVDKNEKIVSYQSIAEWFTRNNKEKYGDNVSIVITYGELESPLYKKKL